MTASCPQSLTEAANAAKRGWAVCVVHAAPGGVCTCSDSNCTNRGKHPSAAECPHGLLDATTDMEQIKNWYIGFRVRNGCDPNWGIATGQSGLVVIDLDPGADIGELGELPQTVTATTGREGGRHLYFQAPEDVELRNTGKGGRQLAQHVDTRGVGGYVVCPGSVHVTGRTYAWIPGLAPGEVELALLPQHLVDRLVKIGAGRSDGAGDPDTDTADDGCSGGVADAGSVAVVGETNTSVRAAARARIPEGARNTTMTSRAGSWWAMGLSREEVRERAHRHNAKFCDPPLDAGEVDRIVDSIISYPTSETPSVVIDKSDIVETLDRLDSALRNRRLVYRRGGELVHVVRGGQVPKFLRRDSAAHTLVPVTADSLKELVAHGCRILVPDSRRKLDLRPDVVPPDVARIVLARRGQGHPLITGLVTAPTLRPDGTLLDEPGYDESTGLLLIDCSIAWPTIPEQPSRDDAREAFGQLADVFRNFPFQSPSDLSGAVAYTVTLVCRPAIGGPVPLFLVMAPVAGTGKTLLVLAGGMVAFGHIIAVMAESTSPDEDRKRLFSVALAGEPALLLDNVGEGTKFGSPALDAALTTGAIQDRRLGGHEMVTVPWTAVVAATGNNVFVASDTARRIVPIYLDPERENPDERGGFVHDPLIPWVAENRPRLYVVALTLVRAYIAAGRPAQDLPRFGSFEAWSDLVRSALVWAGAADPCGGRARVRSEADPDREVLGLALAAWWARYGSKPQTCSAVVQDIGDALDAADRAIRDAIGGICRVRAGQKWGARELGYALRAKAERRVNGLRFVRCGCDAEHRAEWAVEYDGSSDTGGTDEPPAGSTSSDDPPASGGAPPCCGGPRSVGPATSAGLPTSSGSQASSDSPTSDGGLSDASERALGGADEKTLRFQSTGDTGDTGDKPNPNGEMSEERHPMIGVGNIPCHPLHPLSGENTADLALHSWADTAMGELTQDDLDRIEVLDLPLTRKW